MRITRLGIVNGKQDDHSVAVRSSPPFSCNVSDLKEQETEVELWDEIAKCDTSRGNTIEEEWHSFGDQVSATVEAAVGPAKRKTQTSSMRIQKYLEGH